MSTGNHSGPRTTRPRTARPDPNDLTWSARLTLGIGAQIKAERHRLGMSAQKLSDACSDLGYPIKRAVIASIESGRREAVSVAEVFVLAQALGISPVKLVIPFGSPEPFEVLPGKSIPTLDAYLWAIHGDQA